MSIMLYGQISSTIIDNAMFGIISCIVNGKNFGDVMSRLVDAEEYYKMIVRVLSLF